MNHLKICIAVFIITLCCFTNTNQVEATKKGIHRHQHEKTNRRRQQISVADVHKKNSLYLDQQIKVLQDLLAKLQKYRDMKNCSVGHTSEDKIRAQNVQAHLQSAQIHAQKAINGVIMGKLFGQVKPGQTINDKPANEEKIGNTTQAGKLDFNGNSLAKPTDKLVADNLVSKPLAANQQNANLGRGPGTNMTQINRLGQNTAGLKQPLILNNIGNEMNKNQQVNFKGTGQSATPPGSSQGKIETENKSVGLVGNVTLRGEVVQCEDYEKFAQSNLTMKRSMSQGSCYCPTCCMACCPETKCPLTPPGSCACPQSPDQCRCQTRSTAYSFPAMPRPNPHGLTPDLPIEGNIAEHVAPSYLVHDDVNAGPGSFIHPDNNADSPFLPHNGPKPFAPDHPELFGLNPGQQPQTPDFFGGGSNHMEGEHPPNPFAGRMVGDPVVGPFGDGMGSHSLSSDPFTGDSLHGQFSDELGLNSPSFGNGMAFMYPSEEHNEDGDGGLLREQVDKTGHNKEKSEHGELSARVFIAQCKDTDSECYYWAVNGYCENPAPFMSVQEVRKKCMLACGECQRLDKEAGTTRMSIISSHLRRSSLRHHGKHKAKKHKAHSHKRRNKH